MAKEVTVLELADWIEKNKHRCWAWDDPEYMKIPRSKKTLEIKYLNFSLDTRDMKIFHIDIRGAGDDFAVDFRDDNNNEKSILDLLELKLKK